MEKSEIKSALLVALAYLVVLMGTCQFRETARNRQKAEFDTVKDSLYRHEKELQITGLEGQIKALSHRNDSLLQKAAVEKSTYSAVRPKVKIYQQALSDKIAQLDSSCVQADSLKQITDSLIVFQNQADSACIETINTLEQVVANKDSSLLIQNQITRNLRDLEKEQALKSQYLTEQLNTALKMQRRKTRQNKILAGSLLLLSGITTAILVPQYLK